MLLSFSHCYRYKVMELFLDTNPKQAKKERMSHIHTPYTNLKSPFVNNIFPTFILTPSVPHAALVSSVESCTIGMPMEPRPI